MISTDWCHHALVGPRPALPTEGHTENSAAFDEFFRDTSYFNQINLALFNDSSLWVVSRHACLSPRSIVLFRPADLFAATPQPALS